jgi:hypothetical protein
VAAAIGVFGCMPPVAADGFNPIGCWQHSFAVAQLCEHLAASRSPEEAGLAYVVGLCHDLGEIFVRGQFAAEFQQVIDAAARTGRPFDDLHREMLGMTHAQMLADINKCMSLPAALRDPIEAFHAAGARRSGDPLARVLWMAENYANGATLASGPGAAVAPLSRPFCLAATGSENPARPDPQVLRCDVLSLTVALARLSPDEEGKLLVPMFPKRAARVWVARGGTMSDFDPVATALDAMAEVSVNNRLPIGREVDGVDGLVVLAPDAGAFGIPLQGQQGAETTSVVPPGTGRKLPVLVLTCNTGRAANDDDASRRRASITLAELAAFTEAIEKNRGDASSSPPRSSRPPRQLGPRRVLIGMECGGLEPRTYGLNVGEPPSTSRPQTLLGQRGGWRVRGGWKIVGGGVRGVCGGVCGGEGVGYFLFGWWGFYGGFFLGGGFFGVVVCVGGFLGGFCFGVYLE